MSLSGSEVFGLLGVLLTALGLIGTAMWRQHRGLKRDIEAVDDRHEKRANEMERTLDELRVQSVSRAEISAMFASLRTEIHDGFKSVTERIDRMWEHRKD